MSSLSLPEHWKNLDIPVPSLHIVLGSGLSSAFDGFKLGSNWRARGELSFGDVNGLVPTTAPGHKGTYRYFQHLPSNQVVCFQVGRLHGYEGHGPRDAIKTVLLPRLAGTPKFLLTNAAGGLKKEWSPGSLMIITDHVNMTGTNPLYGPNPVGPDDKPLGARFPDMSEVYSLRMRTQLHSTLLESPHKFNVVEGIYLGLSGPAYETPAEVRLYANWGFGAVGMSTVWEAMALKHAGTELAGLSFISNLGCGLGSEPLSHEEVEREGKKIAVNLVDTLFLYAEKEMNS